MFTGTKGARGKVCSRMLALVALSLAVIGLLCMAACAYSPGSVLDSIQVRPDLTSISPAEHQQFTATATWGDGSQQDVTKLATWSSSSTRVATIDSSAMATGIAAGSTTITAFFPAGVLTSGNASGTTTLTVYAGVQLTSITVSPATASLLVGDHQQFSATGTYSDGRY